MVIFYPEASAYLTWSKAGILLIPYYCFQIILWSSLTVPSQAERQVIRPPPSNNHPLIPQTLPLISCRVWADSLGASPANTSVLLRDYRVYQDVITIPFASDLTFDAFVCFPVLDTHSPFGSRLPHSGTITNQVGCKCPSFWSSLLFLPVNSLQPLNVIILSVPGSFS